MFELIEAINEEKARLLNQVDPSKKSHLGSLGIALIHTVIKRANQAIASEDIHKLEAVFDEMKRIKT